MKKVTGLTLMGLIEYGLNELESKPKRTKWENARLENAKRILANTTDDGRLGKCFELLFVAENSHKSGVASQGKTDGYFTLNGKKYPVEYKINGGRIEALYRCKKPENRYIVYTMDIITRTYTNKDGSIGGGQHRIINPVILTVKDFLEIVDTLNATKVIGHKGKNDNERSLQSDSKKLYKALLEYPIEFNPDYNYTTDDFEDLEVL